MIPTGIIILITLVWLKSIYIHPKYVKYLSGLVIMWFSFNIYNDVDNFNYKFSAIYNIGYLIIISIIPFFKSNEEQIEKSFYIEKKYILILYGVILSLNIIFSDIKLLVQVLLIVTFFLSIKIKDKKYLGEIISTIFSVFFLISYTIIVVIYFREFNTSSISVYKHITFIIMIFSFFSSDINDKLSTSIHTKVKL